MGGYSYEEKEERRSDTDMEQVPGPEKNPGKGSRMKNLTDRSGRVPWYTSGFI